MLVALSIERLYIIYDPLSVRYVNRSLYLKSVVACLLVGLIWPLLPLFGWSHYSFEGYDTSCSVEWSERSFNVISYNITILIFVFVIPLIILVYTNVKLIYAVSIDLINLLLNNRMFIINVYFVLFKLKEMNRRQRNIVSTKSMKKKILLERLLTVIAIILIGNNIIILNL